MLALTVMFIIIDQFYMCWIYQVKHKFPAYIAENVSKTLYGFGTKMADNLEQNFKMKVANIREGKNKAVRYWKNFPPEKVGKRYVKTSSNILQYKPIFLRKECDIKLVI